MRFACRIANVTIQTHTDTIWHLFLHDWLIANDLVKDFYCIASKNQVTTDGLCHYDLCSQSKLYILRRLWVKEPSSVSVQRLYVARERSENRSQYSFFSKTGSYDLYCCWWHTFTIQALLWNSHCYLVESDMKLNNVVFPLQDDYSDVPNCNVVCTRTYGLNVAFPEQRLVLYHSICLPFYRTELFCSWFMSVTNITADTPL